MLSNREKNAYFARYFCTCIILIVTAYIALWQAPVPHSATDLIHFLSPKVGAEEHHSFKTKILLSLVGFGRSWVSPNFLFFVPLVQSKFKQWFYLHHLSDEAFLVRNLAGHTVWPVIGMTVAIVFIGILALKACWGLRQYPHRRVMGIVLATCLVDYAVGGFTDPIAVDQFVFVIPLFIALLGAGLHASKSAYRLLVVTLLILLPLNLVTSIVPAMSIKNDFYISKLMTINKKLTRQDLLIYHDPKINQYYQLFECVPQTLERRNPKFEPVLKQFLKNPKQGNIWIEHTHEKEIEALTHDFPELKKATPIHLENL